MRSSSAVGSRPTLTFAPHEKTGVPSSLAAAPNELADSLTPTPSVCSARVYVQLEPSGGAVADVARPENGAAVMPAKRSRRLPSGPTTRAGLFSVDQPSRTATGPVTREPLGATRAWR